MYSFYLFQESDKLIKAENLCTRKISAPIDHGSRFFYVRDTLAYAYRHSRINPRITQIKTAMGDKVDILVANVFQMHLIFPIT